VREIWRNFFEDRECKSLNSDRWLPSCRRERGKERPNIKKRIGTQKGKFLRDLQNTKTQENMK